MAGGIIGELRALFGFKIDKESLTAVNSTISGVKSAAASIGAGVSILGISHLIEKSVEGATHMLAMAKSTGISTTALQFWNDVSVRSGSNVNQFSVGVAMLERNFRSFAEGVGGKRLAATMQEVGLTATDARKALTSPDGMDTALLKIADHFKAMGDTAERGALGFALFGQRAGRALVADLARGSAGLEEMRAHLRSIGGVIDEKTLGNLKELNNGIIDIKESLTASLANAVAAVGPMLNETIGKVTAWIGENSDQIRGFFVGVVTGISAVITVARTIWEGFATIVSGVLSVFGVDANNAKIAGAALGVVLGVLAVKFAFMWLAALGPIGLVIAAVGAAVALITKYWDDIVEGVEFVGEKIKSAFEAAFDFIRNLPVIKQLFDLVDKLDEFIGKPKGADQAQAVLDKQAEESGSIVDRIGAWANNFLNEHSTFAALAGGGTNDIRRAENGAFAPTEQNTTINQTNNYNISGVGPEEVRREIEEHHAQQMRDAHATANGGRP